MGQFMDDAYDEVDAVFEQYMELRDDPQASKESIAEAFHRWRTAEGDLRQIEANPLFGGRTAGA